MSEMNHKCYQRSIMLAHELERVVHSNINKTMLQTSDIW